jgi:hypothetical protein
VGHTVWGKNDNAGKTLFPKAWSIHHGFSSGKMKNDDQKSSLRNW